MSIQPKFRATEEEERLLTAAAKLAGFKTVSSFVRAAANEKAGEILNRPKVQLIPTVRQGEYETVRVSGSARRAHARINLATERVTRLCPQQGCLWRAFGDPQAVCPKHRKGVDQ